MRVLTRIHPASMLFLALLPAAALAEGVTLTAAQVSKLGVVSTALTTAQWRDESIGFGVVEGHDAIAAAVAEQSTAQAAVSQSRAALARVQQLSGGAGALPVETQENAGRQAATDEAALALARRHLTTVVGEHPAWPQNAAGPMLTALADGHARLIRATFPPATTLPAVMTSLRLSRIGAMPADKGWVTGAAWPAPADPTLPGRSFFAVLRDSGPDEGERLEVRVATGAPRSGVRVPLAAVVQNADQYWCYVEDAPGKYHRVAITVDRPQGDDYFADQDLKPGQHVVTAGAALLLAQEAGSGGDE